MTAPRQTPPAPRRQPPARAPIPQWVWLVGVLAAGIVAVGAFVAGAKMGISSGRSECEVRIAAAIDSYEVEQLIASSSPTNPTANAAFDSDRNDYSDYPLSSWTLLDERNKQAAIDDVINAQDQARRIDPKLTGSAEFATNLRLCIAERAVEVGSSGNVTLGDAVTLCWRRTTGVNSDGIQGTRWLRMSVAEREAFATLAVSKVEESSGTRLNTNTRAAVVAFVAACVTGAASKAGTEDLGDLFEVCFREGANLNG